MSRIPLTGNEKILVVRNDRIGDVVLSTPVAEALEKKFPLSFICFFVSSLAADVLKENPYVDELLVDEKSKYGGFFKFWKLISTLKQKNFEVALILKPTLRTALACFLAGIKYRIGSAYRAYSIFFNVRVRQHRKTIQKHELEYNLDMLSVLGIVNQKLMPQVFLGQEERKEGTEFLKKFGILPEENFMIVHIGGGRSALNWPLENYTALVDKLMREEAQKIAITGNLEELYLADKLIHTAQKKPYNLVGKTDVRLLTAILEKASLMVCSSTGPLHLAAALKVPTVALFCPIKSASPVRWGPYGNLVKILLPPIDTCECKLNHCQKGNCMEQIEVEEVFQACQDILKQSKILGQL